MIDILEKIIIIVKLILIMKNEDLMMLKIIRVISIKINCMLFFFNVFVYII